MNNTVLSIGIDCRLWNETGVGRYMRNLVYQLTDIDVKNTYTLFVREKDYENIKNQIVNSKNWKIVKADIRWHTIEEQIKFPQILYKEHLDLVHFPYFSFPVLYKRPFVITIHDLILHHFATGEASTLPKILYYGKRLGYAFLMNYGANRAKKIIAVSHATKNEIVDHLHVSEDKIVVTYEGVDQNLSSKLKVKSLKLPLKDQKYFLYVGNAYPHKNLETLIDAFRIVISKNRDIKLILVGKQDFFYKRLERKIQTFNLEHSVIHYQNISDKELGNLYQHALALVLPSRMEGFGLPVLEAMANKCLVLASDIPAIKEICEDSAIYFNPKNTDDVAEKLLAIYKNKDVFHEKINKGLQRSKEFSWKKMAEETVKIYESCIGL